MRQYESLILITVSLNTFRHQEENAHARTLELEQRVYLGVSVLQGLILAAVSAKYRSAGRTTAGDLISSDSTLKNKPIYQFAMKSKACIPGHRH